MTVATTELRDAFEAWCNGDNSAGPLLVKEIEVLGRQVHSRYAHQAVSEQDAKDHGQTMLRRLWNQRAHKLADAALATDPILRFRLLRQAAVRGASEAEMERALGRPLDDDEREGLQGRIPTDGRTRSYLRQGFRNRFNRLLQQAQRVDQLDADRPVAAAVPSSPEFSEDALDLLERLLGDFEAWGNDRSNGSGTRNMQSLEELAWADRDGLSAQTITRKLQPELDGEALRKAGGTRGRAWRRARVRFHEFLEETRMTKDERDLVDEVRAAFDDRYRLRARSTVRKPSQTRPPAQRSDP